MTQTDANADMFKGYEVARQGLLQMQVCVPATATDQSVVDYANITNPAGTEGGWFIVKQGHELLGGDDERVQCQENNDNVHIVLIC